MRHRLWAVLCVLCLLLTACSNVTSTSSTTTASAVITTTTAASTTTLPSTTQTTTTTVERTTTTTASTSVSTGARVGLYVADTMEALYEQDSNERIYPASLTKILTAYTALQYVEPDVVFTVASEQSLVKKGSSRCQVWPGHRLSLQHLLTGMLMASGNDAAYTVAVNVARTVYPDTDMSNEQAVAAFCELMNHTAQSLGAVNSHFTTPDGWDDSNQYSTVRDLALLTKAAMEVDIIREIVASPKKRVTFASGHIAEWSNTNSLLHSDSPHYLPEATGFKTGSTSKAGKCLIATVCLDNTEYIAVVTGCTDNDQRYLTTLNLLQKIG